MKKNLSLLLAFFLFSNINLLQSQTEYNPEIYGARAVQPEGQTQSDLQQFTKHFHPRFIFNLEYDDNVFLTPTDEQDDVLFILSPGILAIFPFDANSHVFTLDYHTDVAFFSEFDDQDFDNHYVQGNLDLNFPKFYVKTHDDFRSTSVRSGTEFTDRIERLENLFSIDVGTDELNKWGVEGGYDLYWIGYEEAAFEEFDHVEHTVGGAIFYDLFTKSKVFVDYRHVFIEYDESPLRDGDADEIFGGIKGELLPKLVGLVKAGYEDRRYEDPTQDFSSVTVGASLGYNLSAHTTFTLAGERRNRESVYSINNFYTSNFVSLTLNQKLFFERLDGRLRFSYQNNDYPIATTEGAITQERDDDFYGVDAGVDYAIRDWLTTGVDYYYIERESNFDIFDFTDNRVLWRTSILL